MGYPAIFRFMEFTTAELHAELTRRAGEWSCPAPNAMQDRAFMSDLVRMATRAADEAPNPTWKRMYEKLADAASTADAFLARTVIQVKQADQVPTYSVVSKLLLDILERPDMIGTTAEFESWCLGLLEAWESLRQGQPLSGCTFERTDRKWWPLWRTQVELAFSSTTLAAGKRSGNPMSHGDVASAIRKIFDDLVEAYK